MKWKIASFLAVFVLRALASTAADALPAECDGSFPDLFETTSPSVVTVTAVTVDPFRLDNRVQANVGSGFFFDTGDLIVTNSHLVYGAKVLVIQLKEKQSVPATLIGADPISDLAVLRLDDGAPHLPALRLGDSDKLRVGEGVMAVGNPLGIGQTATVGVVSALNRVLPISTMSYLMPFIQIDAAINPGNSGGPLVNRCGEVVGITTGVIKQAQGIGFAVPANLVKQIVPELIAHGHVARPWYGIYGRIINPLLASLLHLPPVQGYLVETIEPGSPAEKIGLKAGDLPVKIAAETFLLGGDIITEVDNTKLTDVETVRKVVGSFKVGQKVRIEYFRPGTGALSAEVVLPERPTLPNDLELGRGGDQ